MGAEEDRAVSLNAMLFFRALGQEEVQLLTVTHYRSPRLTL